MNREQMIAWLTLEGWELCVDKLGPPLLRRGDDRIWLSSSREVCRDTVRGLSVEFVISERPVEDHEVSVADVAKLYDAIIKEKDHEPR